MNSSLPELTDEELADHSHRQPSSIMAWLKLLRLPTVFTSISNVLCGFLITADAEKLTEILRQPELWLLILSSSCLYLSGMVLNDAFDARLDAEERPERPIPSGAVSSSMAFGFGFLLMAAGLLVSFLVTPVAVWIAVGIAFGVLLYDSLLKNTRAAPFGMAGCRFLNLLLGSAAAVPLDEIVTFENPALPVAMGLAVYVFGVTVYAMNEAGEMSVKGLWSGVILFSLGILIHAGTAATMLYQTESETAKGTLLMLTLLFGNVLLRAIVAIEKRESWRLQKTVGFLLLNIIFFDAAMTYCLTGSGQFAACLLLLVAPATLLKKVLPLS